MKLTKENEYAAKLVQVIWDMFDEDSESEYKIDLEEFEDGENATHFIHALANIAPNIIYGRLTNDHKNSLEFSHLANHLVFQYSKKDKQDNS